MPHKFLDLLTIENGLVKGVNFDAISPDDLPAGGQITVLAGAGLSGGGAAAPGGSVTLSVTFGAAGGTACEGNDPRLSAGAPGGADTQIQFNDAGAFGGNAGMAFNKTTKQFLNSDGTRKLSTMKDVPGTIQCALQVIGGALNATFIDTTNGITAALSDGTHAAHFADGTSAALFSDGVRLVLICDGTNAVFATAGLIRALGTSGNTFVWSGGVGPPGTTQGGAVPASAYGQGANNNYLGEPDNWVLVNIGGTDYKLPAYLP